jgi:hypothetical protein
MPVVAATTKHPVSMARDRNSVCQWATPVTGEKEDGTLLNKLQRERMCDAEQGSGYHL